MNPEDELLALYEEWRIVTAAETDAIHAEAWTRVNQCQEAKQRLQVRILETTDRGQRQGTLADKLKLRKIVDHLAALEIQNKMGLARKQERVRQQQTDLETAERTLHRLHRAYAPGERTGWHSYS